jgi:hypothetical protein
MEDERRPNTRTTYLFCALISFLLVEPALLLIQHHDHGLPYEESGWYALLLAVTFLVIPCAIGIVVSKRHTDYPLRTSAIATLCASGVIIVFALIRIAANDNSVTFEKVIKYIVYLQFTIALSVISAYIALRTRVLKQAARLQQSAANQS